MSELFSGTGLELSNCGVLVGPTAPVVFDGAVVPLLVTVPEAPV